MNKTAADLGYDPRPHVRDWRGTPIPSVDRPLPASGGLEAVAERMWWNGPPWTILRNGPSFLRHVMDHGRPDDVATCERVVPAELWTQTLLEAKPGSMSRTAHRWFCVKRGLFRIRDLPAWPRSHLFDHRGRANEDRMRMYERITRARAAAHGLTPEEAVRLIVPPPGPPPPADDT